MSVRFQFAGSLPPSKSLQIRALLLQAYEPRIHIPMLSSCEDVQAMSAACHALRSDAPQVQADCGEAGLVLRLCLAFASRRGGVTYLRGSPRLLARPHDELLRALRELGTEIEMSPSSDALIVRSPGRAWRPCSQPLSLAGGTSSQFASALLLNAWDLPFALQIVVGREPVSQGYLAMSRHMAGQFGLQIEDDGDGMLTVPPGQRIVAGVASGEADVSSAFAVVALAAVAGHAHIHNFPLHSQQPDAAFVDLLRRMGVAITLDGEGLQACRAEDPLRPLSADVSGCPDLVPVLAVLCALADGRSRLFGAPHLRGKESDRIATSASLLRMLGRAVEETDDGLVIDGRPFVQTDALTPLRFDAGRDHRLVMAAAVARYAGFPVAIENLRAVDKSFPEFLDIAGLR